MVLKKFSISLLVFCIGLTAAVAIPQFRDAIRKKFLTEQRKVLAKASSNINADEQEYLILKVKHKNMIQLEVFLKSESSLKLLQKFTLQGTFDGFFTFAGEATNLVITNLDYDPQLEILAPTFDDDFVAHLQIFKFNIASQQFELLNEENWPSTFQQPIIER